MQIRGEMSFQLESPIGIWLLLVTSYCVRMFCLPLVSCCIMTLMYLYASLLIADVKQYPNLIKTLCFLLNSYKPKDEKVVDGSSQRNKTVTISGNHIWGLPFASLPNDFFVPPFFFCCRKANKVAAAIFFDELASQDRQRWRNFLFWLWECWSGSRTYWISCVLHQP